MSNSFEEHASPAYLVGGVVGSVQEGGTCQIGGGQMTVAAREIAQCYEDLREKEAEIERLRQYAGQCEASVHSTQQGYAELQQEIERLKTGNAKLNEHVTALLNDVEQYRAFSMRDAMYSQNSRLKNLLIRAAHSLECTNWNLIQPEGQLIKELR